MKLNFASEASLIESQSASVNPTQCEQGDTAHDGSARIKAPGETIQSRTRFSRKPSVKVYVRHGKRCPKYGDRYARDCHCPKWLSWSEDGEYYRQSANTRSWNEAERRRQEMEDSLDPVRVELKKLKEGQRKRRVVIRDAVDDFIADTVTRGIGKGSQYKFRMLLYKRLLPWCEGNGLQYIDQLTTQELTRWRNTWPPYRGETPRTYQNKITTFFGFCVKQEWLERNPVRNLTRLRSIPTTETDYFNREEFEKLVAGTYLLEDTPDEPNFSLRLRTLLLLRRWSGLRLGDAVTLQRSRLDGNNLFLRRQSKTQRPVYVPLPPETAEALREVPPGRNSDPRYFFWDGQDKDRAVNAWERAFRRLFRIVDLRNPDGTPKRCHGQMLRDTFSVELFLTGAPLEEVSKLLGHTSIQITHDRYAPWVPARQERLKETVTRAHQVPGITKGVTKIVNIEDFSSTARTHTEEVGNLFRVPKEGKPRGLKKKPANVLQPAHKKKMSG